MQEGDRVRLTKYLQIYGLGVFHKGATGTICDLAEDDHDYVDMPLYSVKLDDHFPELDGWGNKLQVFIGDWEVTPDIFELIPPPSTP